MLFDENFYQFLGRMLGQLSAVLASQKADDRREVMCLIAGLMVLKQLASEKVDAPNPEQLKQLNYTLRTAIGSGHSWVSCIQFLSGSRASMALSTHRDFLAKLGGPELPIWGELVLPFVDEAGGYNGMLGGAAYEDFRSRYDEVFTRNLEKSFQRLNETVPGVFVNLDDAGVVHISHNNGATLQ
ncbi:hypothetical protein BLA23254_06911 [Burkholderia lata]|uniref:Uncharacterized protein n=1 Tax=Burkholderia lata (strain ATCC 17760 / DSM 23089 / LMG 22485 / NCIMB 9086 / R18194 / 383) TaxID=482957 RepID=A0A6P2S277_BURL3|nr:hypothetical protein [Burkholderia lata]VWC40265.1 hypothetical protein BLA23254_06911 [Burkholderia lata]